MFEDETSPPKIINQVKVDKPDILILYKWVVDTWPGGSASSHERKNEIKEILEKYLCQ